MRRRQMTRPVSLRTRSGPFPGRRLQRAIQGTFYAGQRRVTAAPPADEEPPRVVLTEEAGLLLDAKGGPLTREDARQVPFSAHQGQSRVADRAASRSESPAAGRAARPRQGPEPVRRTENARRAGRLGGASPPVAEGQSVDLFGERRLRAWAFAVAESAAGRLRGSGLACVEVCGARPARCRAGLAPVCQFCRLQCWFAPPVQLHSWTFVPLAVPWPLASRQSPDCAALIVPSGLTFHC